jgi:type IV pilus assembly protein PilW
MPMPSLHENKGFGLIEIMIGVVISIVASLAIFQVFALSERQKRTTTGAADAQTNGAIGLYMLERDARIAGWGLEGSIFANCNTIYSYDGSTGTGAENPLAPVVITEGGGAGPDSITLQYYDDPANRNFKFATTTLTSTMPQSSSELNVSSTYGCANIDVNGDGVINNQDVPRAIIQQGGNCTVMDVTNVNAMSLKLQHNPGEGNNPSASYQHANGWPAYSTGAKLQCFNKSYTKTYRIVNEQLQLQNRSSTGVSQTYDIAPDIIDMQAQYGVAAPGSQQVTAWVNATGAGTWGSPLSAANAKRIKAIRVAIVARSGQYEKPASGTCDTTTSSMAAAWSSWATFNTSTYPADWQCYRYRVFETVIPLRNVIWANA